MEDKEGQEGREGGTEGGEKGGKRKEEGKGKGEGEGKEGKRESYQQSMPFQQKNNLSSLETLKVTKSRNFEKLYEGKISTLGII